MTRKIEIDLLVLDLTTCDRCVGSDRSIDTALDVVRDVLDVTDAAVDVRRTVVETAEQARELRFVSSPTIRVNGRDIAPGLSESTCESDACACGNVHIDCRLWSYDGEQHTQAPVGLIVDAVLGELYAGSRPARASDEKPYELPANLSAFYAEATPAVVSSCSSEEQATCCAASEKAACCSSPASEGGCECR